MSEFEASEWQPMADPNWEELLDAMEARAERAEAEIERLRAKIGQVAAAVYVEGARPGVHRSTMERHRHEWPTLWSALDDLLPE